MAVYEIEKDAGLGNLLTAAANMGIQLIQGVKKAKADAPGLTKDLTEKLLAEGKDTAPEDAWKILTKIFPKADRDVFEGIYFGRVLDQAERHESMAGGFITQMGGKYTNPKYPANKYPRFPGEVVGAAPPSATSSAPAAELPSPMSPSPGAGRVWGQIAENALQGKAAEASPTGGIAPGRTEFVTAEPTDDSVVGKAVATAKGVTAGIQLPPGIDTTAANTTELQQQFRGLVGTLTPEHMDYFAATAAKLRGDEYGRVNQLLGYNVRDRLDRYGMAPSAQRMVINGIVGQLAGVRDIAKEELVFGKTIADVAETWRNLDFKDRELGARVIDMYTSMQLRANELKLKGNELEFQAKYQQAMVELQKMGVETDRARLIVTAALGADAAEGGGGGGRGGGRGGASTFNETMEAIKTLQGFEPQMQQAMAIENEEQREAAVARVEGLIRASLEMVTAQNPQTGAMVLAYMDSSDLYSSTASAQAVASMLRGVPEVQRQLELVMMAPAKGGLRAERLVEFYRVAEPAVQEFIASQTDPALANFHRQTWERIKTRGSIGLLSREEAANKAAGVPVLPGSTTGPQAPAVTVAGGRPGAVPLTAPPPPTDRSVVMNALAGGGATAQGPLASPDAEAAIGIPKARENGEAQKPYAATIVDAAAKASAEFGVEIDPALIAAMIDTESNWKTTATSPKGAYGLMQIMPATQKHLGITDPKDPHQIIKAGARYLGEMLQRYGNLEHALIAYNAGPEFTDDYLKNPGRIGLYGETATYLKRVKSFYEERKTINTV